MRKFCTKVFRLAGASTVMAVSVVSTLENSAKAQAVAAASSPDYSLEYVSTAASGSVINIGNYTVVSQVQLSGIAYNSASSSNYSVAPLMGASSGLTAVSDWNLYY